MISTTFSMDGRVGRLKYFAINAALLFISSVADLASGSSTGAAFYVSVSVIVLATSVAILAAVKRCNDIGVLRKHALWLLFLPSAFILGPYLQFAKSSGALAADNNLRAPIDEARNRIVYRLGAYTFAAFAFVFVVSYVYKTAIGNSQEESRPIERSHSASRQLQPFNPLVAPAPGVPASDPAPTPSKVKPSKGDAERQWEEYLIKFFNNAKANDGIDYEANLEMRGYLKGKFISNQATLKANGAADNLETLALSLTSAHRQIIDELRQKASLRRDVKSQQVQPRQSGCVLKQVMTDAEIAACR